MALAGEYDHGGELLSGLVVFWIQFLSWFPIMNNRGLDLMIYVESPEPFGIIVPELWLWFSVAVSLFAIGAVFGGTRGCPGLWKRMVAVLIFSGISIGYPLLMMERRHLSYARTLVTEERYREAYHRALVTDDEDLEWSERPYKRVSEILEAYEEKYGTEWVRRWWQ